MATETGVPAGQTLRSPNVCGGAEVAMAGPFPAETYRLFRVSGPPTLRYGSGRSHGKAAFLHAFSVY